MLKPKITFKDHGGGNIQLHIDPPPTTWGYHLGYSSQLLAQELDEILTPFVTDPPTGLDGAAAERIERAVLLRILWLIGQELISLPESIHHGTS